MKKIYGYGIAALAVIVAIVAVGILLMPAGGNIDTDGDGAVAELRHDSVQSRIRSHRGDRAGCARGDMERIATARSFARATASQRAAGRARAGGAEERRSVGAARAESRRPSSMSRRAFVA